MHFEKDNIGIWQQTQLHLICQFALKEKSTHKAKESIYRHVSVTTAFEELFINKCAYCETQLNAGYSWEVEHFRPKGAVL